MANLHHRDESKTQNSTNRFSAVHSTLSYHLSHLLSAIDTTAASNVETIIIHCYISIHCSIAPILSQIQSSRIIMIRVAPQSTAYISELTSIVLSSSDYHRHRLRYLR